MLVIKDQVFLTLICFMLTQGLSISASADTSSLTLEAVADIAVLKEPGILAAQANAKSYSEKAVYSRALPDPQIRFGLMNVPVNNFNFNQEAMTQKQIGLRQSLPRFGSRDAKQRMHEYEAQAFRYAAEVRKREVVQMARNAWLELYYWLQAKGTLTKNRELFSRLVKVTRSLYSVGRQNQQDMVRAELELSRFNDRLIMVDDQILQAQTTLEQWVGSEAFKKPLSNQLPNWAAPPTLTKLLESLSKHPRLAMSKAKIESADAHFILSKSNYKPEFSLDLNYGVREDDLLGNPRDNFISFMVTMDMPLFAGKRQDKQSSAAMHVRDARKNDREMILRDMSRQLKNSYTHWQQLQFRLELYKSTILQQSKSQSSAALNVYQNDNSDFSEVMRAHIAELSTQLEYIRLQVDQVKALVSLDYYSGMIDTTARQNKSEKNHEL